MEKIIKVPTGKIFVIDGENGKIESLSLQDYGQPKNCKAQFLGLNEDINGVDNGNELLPFEDKWVITISTQYGCSCNCKFCDVPKVKHNGNISFHDMMRQVNTAIMHEPQVVSPKRINLHYARMGEPTYNKDVIAHARAVGSFLRGFYGNDGLKIHPVISTMMPKHNKSLFNYIDFWTELKTVEFKGDAGLQLSINSTDDKQRDYMFNGLSLSLKEISDMMKKVRKPRGRKYTLNFALSDETIIDAKYLATLFNSEDFMVKITPIHNTKACIDNKIQTSDGYESFTPYQRHEEALIEAGFDVLIFVPSKDEETGKITCGNAVLAYK